MTHSNRPDIRFKDARVDGIVETAITKKKGRNTAAKTLDVSRIILYGRSIGRHSHNKAHER
jgi:hypothetical protein